MKVHSLPDDLRAELAIGLLGVEVKVLETCLERVVHGMQIDLGSGEQVRPAVSTAKTDCQLLSEFWPKFVELMVNEEGWRCQSIS